MLWKLSNPLYTAAEEYAETDAAWSARMVNMAPDPDLFQAGRMHAHVTLLDFISPLQTASMPAAKG